MRLKTLEIKGFKSFSNETVIHFNEDVIGIVGPNGSGKSNVIDAIRWVLGEQKSKELRLDTMQSVIFNGTKKRKKAPKAQVSLTFENSKNILPTDYQSVTISRSLYRTGESEYHLNNVPCRLKDITSLFLDTGIGSNSYAIIALNMVDDLLNDKENSRLKMFEQAAGISKYKMRKKETLNKLKSTSADLERVEDLLFEIEGNLKSLESQARKTKRFFDLKEKYKTLSLELAAIKIFNLKEKQNNLKTQYQSELDAYRNFDVKVSELEAELEAERKANLDKEKALSDRQRSLNQLVGEIRGKENEKNMSQQRLEFVQQNSKKYTEQIGTLQTKSGDLERHMERYSIQLSEEKRVEVELEKQLDEVEAQLKQMREGHGSAKADLDDMLKAQQAVERELFELEKEKAIIQNRLDNLQQEIEQADGSDFQRKLELKELKKRIADVEVQEKQCIADLERLEKEADDRQSALKNTEEKLEVARKKMQEVNRKLDSKRNEYKLTLSMVESMEGFPESIKFLSGQKDFSKNSPLLSDLIYVKETSRVAIENYLENYLNYYVVDKLEDAYNAIKLLNKSQKGKANFFILEAFENYEAPLALLPGTISAIDLIEIEPKYRKLFSFLLENVLITENENLAQVPQQGNYVVLSNTGHFIKRRFSISGGSVGLFEGKKIGRKKNLEHLEAEIKKLEKDSDKATALFFDLKSKVDQLKGERDDRKIRQAREALNGVAQQKISLNSKLEGIQQVLGDSVKKLKLVETEIADLNKKSLEIDQNLNEKSSKVLEAKSKISNVDASYKEISEKLSAASGVYNERNISFIRQQNKVTAIQREAVYTQKQLEEIKATIEKDRRSILESDEESIEISDKIARLDKELQEAYLNRKEKESLLTDAEQSYFQARGGINEIEDNLRKLNKSRQDAQILINNLKDKLTDVRLEVTSLSERLRVEFNLEINDLLKDDRFKLKESTDNEKVDATELRMKVERLKNRLDNYGEINPMAVEAFDAMKERYDTITQQRNDIENAKVSLMETIQEIEETATAQFLDAFEKVRIYFIDVFRSLFTMDDDADLVLLNPDNPLESKIEIVAKPKGKRPQTIAQLSGGEKTLTATALLFALYLLKPAPFCIFDEVDAPLDDANISKFNQIIKKFSKDSQFIVVTHNKLTMAAVDVIYGVHMPEQGVSAVTPVDFRSLNHEGRLEAAVG